MKTRLFFIMLIVCCISCESNKTISEHEKDKIKGEIKDVADRMFQGCEEANFEMASEALLDSPDFIFLINGRTYTYQESVDAIKPKFSLLSDQKVTIIDEKYSILDESTVLYTTNCIFLENYKDGHSSLNDPTAILCIYKKINDEWKAIYAVESYVKKSIENEDLEND